MVDLTFLKQFTKDDSKKMKRYISLYLDVAPKTFEEMQRNLQNGDWLSGIRYWATPNSKSPIP